MWRLIKSILSWALDQSIEHAGTIVSTAGGLVMIYLASIADWLNPYGPVAYGAIGIASFLLLSFAFYVLAVMQGRLALADYTRAKAVPSGVNVLAPSHQHEKIHLTDFYHPFFKETEHMRFQQCEFFGPANVHVNGCTIDGALFRECEIVIVRGDRPVVGAIAFKFCNFLDCRFFRVTWLMNLDQYRKLPDKFRKDVPVISDGRIGDI